MTFARFVTAAENRSAFLAVREVAASLGSRQSYRAINPLYLHGPAGTGKTHLAAALVDEVTRQCPQLIVTLCQAEDFDGMARSGEITAVTESLLAARQSDLLIVEDLQHLCGRHDDAGTGTAEVLVQVFDYLYTRQRQLVFTAAVGPGRLAHLPARLVSRLGCGLVVSLQPLHTASRLALLQEKAQRRQLAVSPEVLGWLAEHLSGGARQLQGALLQLETLSRLHDQPLDVQLVADHFREQAHASQLTVERIAQRVGSHFWIEPRYLQSRRRHQNVVLPRQIGMYLARQLTSLSLKEIGRYFGGRDHSTVLHACRKIEEALLRNLTVSGAVRQLQSELV